MAKTNAAQDYSNLVGQALAGKPLNRAKKPEKHIVKLKNVNAAKALRFIGGLQSINKILERLDKYSRSLVINDTTEELASAYLAGNKGSMTVQADGAEALIVPMRKYVKIDDDKLADLQRLGVPVVEKTKFTLTETIAQEIAKNPEILQEITAAIAKSKNLSADMRKKIASGIIPVTEETTSYEYEEDILDNLKGLSGGSVKKAMEILDTTHPIITIRSVKVNGVEVEENAALDLIKEALASMQEIEEK